MTQCPFVTLKEIAAVLWLTPDGVRKAEAAYGLDKCRDQFCRKPRRYHKEAVIRELRGRGHEVIFQ